MIYVNEVPAQADVKSIDAVHGDNYLMLGSGNLHSYWDINRVKMVMRGAKENTDIACAKYLTAHVNLAAKTPG